MATSIPNFQNFDAFYKAIGFHRIAPLPDFDIIQLEGSMNVAVSFMPPFRKAWYQLVFKLNPVKSVVLNTQRIEPKNTLVLFNSPNHIYSWQLDTDLRGFILFFTPAFMASVPNLEQEFPFFHLTESNLINVDSADIPELKVYLDQMLAVAANSELYQRQILQSLLLAFLYRCKSAYQRQQQAKRTQPRHLTIIGRYQQLINSFYLEKKTVGAYAELLNLTPNYLNELVKETTGKSARFFIVERIMTEARNLLQHTDLDISRIAYALQFDEPTNFVRFFRKYAGQTPGQFRLRHLTQTE